MSQTNWEDDTLLDVYIHEYLVKRDIKASAQAFQAEGKVSSDLLGSPFRKFGFVRASTSKVVCCHFSSEGKLLASGGHDKMAVLRHADSLKPKSTLKEHSALITDVRFSPSMPHLATSSSNKTGGWHDRDEISTPSRNITCCSCRECLSKQDMVTQHVGTRYRDWHLSHSTTRNQRNGKKDERLMWH
ncbi:hypothetical protein POM88_032071 [Heracleum sosnowskyi]|uniref:LisH domain-containing protein n=1 Tax=Heracleum sosnowskyi TaxID=360622 RepID=A0AAD8HZF3_9APIA|nr:hypothetical protein POM88_032071 [Heracleum sosnowskyi]